ncbi:MAG: hypothetical protein JXA99_03360 [Candidatus Lokiarchaeota archaeon]|nr:hypothetical protein [Candidatus Lokiarchaeota archaeon]
MNCIFHIPWKLNNRINIASEIRPLKILEALKISGFKVEIVWGSVKERKKRIKDIKNKILEGTKFDFLYSESSTLPTALTEPHHLPLNPFMDFHFFKFCRKHNIPIGLYLRDVYWNFPYIKRFNKIKHYYALFFHIYDILHYNQFVDAIFLPNIKMLGFIPFLKKSIRAVQLSPGTSLESKGKSSDIKYPCNTFIYVGNININKYDLRLLFRVFNDLPDFKLIINCPKESWVNYKSHYNKFLTTNISIHHLNNIELFRLYQQVSLSFIFIRPTPYWQIALPFKLFEYISHGIPIVAVEGTAVAEFLKSNRIGYSIEYSEYAIKDFLNNLPSREEYTRLIENLNKCRSENSWEKRIETIVNILC